MTIKKSPSGIVSVRRTDFPPSPPSTLFARFSHPYIWPSHGLNKQRCRKIKNAPSVELDGVKMVKMVLLVPFGWPKREEWRISVGPVKPNQKCQASFSVVRNNACQDCISLMLLAKKVGEAAIALVQLHREKRNGHKDAKIKKKAGICYIWTS